MSLAEIAATFLMAAASLACLDCTYYSDGLMDRQLAVWTARCGRLYQEPAEHGHLLFQVQRLDPSLEHSLSQSWHNEHHAFYMYCCIALYVYIQYIVLYIDDFH